jgi:hypothetical protein
MRKAMVINPGFPEYVEKFVLLEGNFPGKWGTIRRSRGRGRPTVTCAEFLAKALSQDELSDDTPSVCV